MSRTKRAAKRIIDAILSAELVVMALLVAATAGAAALGWQPYCVLTGSMAPSMPAGTLVWVDTHVQPAQLVQGDVVAFKADSGAQVTHRIVENDVESALMTTKGDANGAADPAPVAYDKVVGKSCLAIPGAGTLLSLLVANKVPIIAGTLAINAALLAASSLIGRNGREGRPSA